MQDEKTKIKEKPSIAVQLVVEPVLVDVMTFASLFSISSRHFAALEKSGHIGPAPVQLGNSSRILFQVDEVRDWIRRGKCCSRMEWQAIKSREK